MPDFDYMSDEDIKEDPLREFKRKLKYYDDVEKMTERYERINKNAEVKTYKFIEEQNRRLDETWIKI